MESKELCTYCMSGYLQGGVCTGCGRSVEQEKQRPLQTLPARCLLGGGQYYLGRVLGSGGFGITYLAWDKANGRKTVVKELFPRHLVSREENNAAVIVQQGLRGEFQHSMLRFQQEAQALYELRGVPEIINVHRLFEENGTAYYVMEYLDGQDLKGYLAKNGAMSWEQFKVPVHMMLKALKAVHERQMIHRDISPDNIFMLRGGGAKLIDFGNARSYMSASPLTKILKTHFAPPEQFSDEARQGPWTDIYSMSVTMYYALSGMLPVSSTERVISLNMQGSDPLKPLGQVCPGIPPYVAQAVEKGMAVKAQDRFQTVSDFAERLFPGLWKPQAVPRSENHPVQKTRPPVSRQPRMAPPPGRNAEALPVLRCVEGKMKGRQLLLRPGVQERLGRDGGASIEYPSNSPGVSRHQCSFMVDNRKQVYVRDDGSSYGTWLNGKTLKPMEWYPVQRGSSIRFAKEEYRIV